MQVRVAAVDHHLLARKVCVPEGRGHIDHGAGLEVVHLLGIHKGLELREGKGKEGRVPGADQNRVIAVVIAAGLEGDDDQLLPCQPSEGLHPQGAEIVAIDILKARLVGGLFIRHPHTVRVPTAHIVLHIVDHCAVFATNHGSLFHRLAVHIIEHLNLIGMLVAEDELVQRFLAVRYDHAGAIVDDFGQFRRKSEFFQQNIHLNGASLSFHSSFAIEAKYHLKLTLP